MINISTFQYFNLESLNKWGSEAFKKFCSLLHFHQSMQGGLVDWLALGGLSVRWPGCLYSYFMLPCRSLHVVRSACFGIRLHFRGWNWLKFTCIGLVALHALYLFSSCSAMSICACHFFILRLVYLYTTRIHVGALMDSPSHCVCYSALGVCTSSPPLWLCQFLWFEELWRGCRQVCRWSLLPW